MPADKVNNLSTATEWMDFYRELFQGKEPVRCAPIPLSEEGGEEVEEFFHGIGNHQPGR